MANYGTYDPTALIAGNKQPVHRVITVASGANAAGAVLARGTLLGRVTATDKYVPSVRTASDGSQNPVAVTAADLDASAADIAAPAYFEGEFAAEKMTIDASWTVAQVQAALRQNNIPIFARVVGTLG